MTTAYLAAMATAAATKAQSPPAASAAGQAVPGVTASPIVRPASPAPVAVPPVVVEQQPAPRPSAPKRKRAAAADQSRPTAPVAKSLAAKPSPSPSPQTAPLTLPVSVAPPPGTLVVVDDAFVPVTVVSGREIEATQGATLTATLQNRPGITGSTFAAGASRPIIRGLGNTRVRVQENGISSADVSNLSEDHAVPIDPVSTESVEVIRGPATLRYGSSAIGGVVSAINDRIPEAIPTNGFKARFTGGVTSVDNGSEGGFAVTAGAGAIALHADAFTRRASDYDTPQGRQTNTFVESDGFAVGGSVVGSWGFAGVAFQRFESLYGIPGVEATLENKRIDLEQEKVTSRGEFKVRTAGIDAIRYWFGSTRYTHFEIADGAAASEFKNRETEGRVEVQHQAFTTPIGRMTGAIGIQVGERKTSGLSLEDPTMADSLLLPAKTETVAAYIFEEIELTRSLTVQLAARHERADVSGVGPDPADRLSDVSRSRAFDPTSASVGVLQALPMGLVARLSAQYTERAPDAQELFSNGPHEATETFELGNVDLGKEKATTVEFGLKKATGPLRFDASVYHTRFKGFIFKELSDEFCDDNVSSCGAVSEGLQLLNFRQRDATFTGADLAMQLDIAPIWRGVWGVEGQFDIVRAKLSGGENVPRIPPVRVGGGVYYRDASWFARINTLHAFEQDKLGLGETETAGYTLLNAELSYTMKLAATGAVTPELTIGLKGENLLDDDVRNHVSFKKEEVLEPGARVRLFGTLKLN